MDTRQYIKRRMAEALETPEDLGGKLQKLTRAKHRDNTTLSIFEDFIDGNAQTESGSKRAKRSRTTTA